MLQFSPKLGKTIHALKKQKAYPLGLYHTPGSEASFFTLGLPPSPTSILGKVHFPHPWAKTSIAMGRKTDFGSEQ